jgi:hypothetical protein
MFGNGGAGSRPGPPRRDAQPDLPVPTAAASQRHHPR